VRRIGWGILLVGCAALAAAGGADQGAETPADLPLDLRLEERTSRRLIQVDVTVTGPPEVIRNLGLVYVPVLMLVYLCALWLLTGYRISRESHSKNLRRLSEEATGQGGA